jgi:hypothetical protein
LIFKRQARNHAPLNKSSGVLKATTELCAFLITRSDKKIRAMTRSFVAQQPVIFTRQQEGCSVEYIETARSINGTKLA